MAIRQVACDQITTSGSDGSAVGTGYSPPISGKLLGIYLNYSAGQPATTDVAITSTSTPSQAILTVTDNKTDGMYYPAHPLQDNAGAAVTFDGTNEIYAPFAVSDTLKIVLAGADDTETLDVIVIYEE